MILSQRLQALINLRLESLDGHRARNGDKPYSGMIIVDNFLDALLTPPAILNAEAMGAISKRMAGAEVDTAQRVIVWPDGARLNIEQSIRRIRHDCGQIPQSYIDKHFFCWLETAFGEQDCSQEQLDEYDRSLRRWIADHHSQCRGAATPDEPLPV